MQGKKTKNKKTRICIWYNATQAYLWKEKKQKQQQKPRTPDNLSTFPLQKSNSFRTIPLSETLY